MIAAPEPGVAGRAVAAAGEVRRIEPAAELGAFVEGYYLYNGVHRPRWVLPNGAVDLILGLKAYSRGGRRFQADPFLLHAHLGRALRLPPLGSVTALSVRFRPGGFRPFTTIPMVRCSSGIHALSGSDLLPWISSLGSRDPEACLGQVDRVLLERVGGLAAAGETTVLRDLPGLLRPSPGPTPANLRSKLGLTHRQLQRLMLDQVGIDCQRLSSLQRVNRALSLKLETGCSWADAAFDSGYSDQPHFVRHTKGFTGMTPTRVHASLRSGESLARWPPSGPSKAPVLRRAPPLRLVSL